MTPGQIADLVAALSGLFSAIGAIIAIFRHKNNTAKHNNSAGGNHP